MASALLTADSQVSHGPLFLPETLYLPLFLEHLMSLYQVTWCPAQRKALDPSMLVSFHHNPFSPPGSGHVFSPSVPQSCHQLYP